MYVNIKYLQTELDKIYFNKIIYMHIYINLLKWSRNRVPHYI